MYRRIGRQPCLGMSLINYVINYLHITIARYVWKKMGINHIAAKASLQPRLFTLLSSLHCSTEIMSRNYVKTFRPKTQ